MTKSNDGRGRFAIGSQAKMNGLTGAAFTIEIIEPCGIGLIGRVSIRVGKDRPGRIREKAGEFRASDRTQPIAEVVVDAKTTPGHTSVTFQPPAGIAEGAAPKPFRPTVLMAKASAYAEKRGDEWLSQNKIATGVGGNRGAALRAVELLMFEGYLDKQVSESGKSSTLRHARRYVEAEDPLSDKFDDPQFGTPGSAAETPPNPFPAT